MSDKPIEVNKNYEEQYGFHDAEQYVFKSKKGLSKGIVEEISGMKEEPAWMRAFRLRALEAFEKKPLPAWADLSILSQIHFDDIYYYLKPTEKEGRKWEEVPTEIKETFDKLGIPEAERKFLAGVTAQYECLSADTVVFANPKATAIKDLKPGNHVYSLNEETKRLEKHPVKAVVYKGNRPVFEVKAGNRRIKATANHPFYALSYAKAPGRQRGRFHAQWHYLSNLTVGDYIAVVKEMPDDGRPFELAQEEVASEYMGRNQFGTFPVSTKNLFTRQQRRLRLPSVTTENLMWFLGLYLGDGFLSRPKRLGEKTIVDIAIPQTDEVTRTKLQKILDEVFGYELTFDRDPYRARIHSKPITQWLAYLGFDYHAKTKRVPGWVYSLPRSQKLSFIAGYIDSDGYVRVGSKNNDAVITSANAQLLRDIQRLGIMAGLHVSDVYTFRSQHEWKGEKKQHAGYRLLIGGDLSILAAESIRCAQRVKPKKYVHRYASAHKSPIDSHISQELGFARIQSIKPLGVEPVYDIEVDGPHNFVAEGIVVHNSEVVYHSIHEDLEKQGVIFLGMDDGLKKHPDLVKKYFGTVIPPIDNKFAALNSAVWSGGSFIYVPKGVHVKIPLQAYFRINAQNMGQFERTLIIADEGSSVHYIEGCLPAGEQVSTGQRWVNIESMRPGDAVLNSDGMEAHVQAVRIRPYRGQMLTIRPISRGNSFRLTPEHPVLAVPRAEVRVPRKSRKNWLDEVSTARLNATHPRFIEAGRLQRGDFMVFPIPQIVKEEARYTISVLRLLGYYLAEGSTFVHKRLKMPVVAFSFGSTDRTLVEETKRLIREVTGKPAYEVQDRTKHGINITVYSRELMDLCLESCGKGAATKELGKTIMELPPEKQAHLLETYLLGDGSRYEKRANTMVRAATVSRNLARQLQELIARQGFYATIRVRKGGPDRILGRSIVRKDQYILYYSPNRQMGEVRRVGNNFLVPIKEIDRTPFDGPVFNIELDRAPNAYLASGFAVHNCTAPVYASDSLHSAVVELVALPHAHIRYTTIQNWSKNVYNLVTKRAVAHENSIVEWLDGNLGSRLTMKYPGVYLVGRKARGEVVSVAFSGRGQHQDAGAKMVHAAPETTSTILSKSIAKDGGRTSYRGLVKVYPDAEHVKSSVRCDALLMDDISRSDTYPTMEVDAKQVQIGHEATVSKVGEEQLFYLMSRGLKEQEATTMVVNGFFEAFAKELPLEYAVELNRLIQLEMEGSVG